MRHTLLLLLATIALVTGSGLNAYGQDYPTEEEIQHMLLPRPKNDPRHRRRGLG